MSQTFSSKLNWVPFIKNENMQKKKLIVSGTQFILVPSSSYRPKTKLREGTIFTPVCQSFCSWGACVGTCAWQGAYMAWGVCGWGEACVQERRPLKRAVRILLEYILVNVHAEKHLLLITVRSF